MISKTSLFGELATKETCSQQKGLPFWVCPFWGGHLIVKNLAVLFTSILVFISCLVGTAGFHRILLSLLTGMVRGTWGGTTP